MWLVPIHSLVSKLLTPRPRGDKKREGVHVQERHESMCTSVLCMIPRVVASRLCYLTHPPIPGPPCSCPDSWRPL